MKFKLTFFLTLILASFSFSNNDTKLGIGAELQLFPSELFLGENSPNLDIYFPIKFDGFTIEPKISFSRIETEVDYDSQDNWQQNSPDYTTIQTNSSVVIGLLKKISGDKVESYAGVRMGRITTKTKIEFENPSLDDTDEENESLIFAPMIGAEYFIKRDISLGLEAIYYTIKTDDENEDYWGYSNSRTQTTESTLIPKLIIRFYFSN
tara:strand:- start:79 stop:702 length:624 start_codon:yes stop_codon:yes gene_type:complete